MRTLFTEAVIEVNLRARTGLPWRDVTVPTDITVLFVDATGRIVETFTAVYSPGAAPLSRAVWATFETAVHSQMDRVRQGSGAAPPPDLRDTPLL